MHSKKMDEAMGSKGMTHHKQQSRWPPHLLVAEIVLGFAFWTVYVEYLPTIWFFPLNRMDFSGHESFLALFLSCGLLGSSSIRSFVFRHAYLIRTIGSFIGMVAFYPYFVSKTHALPFPANIFADCNTGKLVLLALALFSNLLVIFRLWMSTNAERRERTLWGTILGLLVFLIFRLSYNSVNPVAVWKVPNLIATAAVVWAGASLIIAERKHAEEPPANLRAVRSSSLAGVSLGGHLFASIFLFSCHGAIPRYLDLNPFPYGILIVLGLLAGALISNRTELIRKPYYFVCTGLVGSILVVLGEDGNGGVASLVGLFGGVLMALYYASTWPVTVSTLASTSKPGRVMFYFLLVFLVLLFWSVWVVAFKFVPWYLGSTLLRERSRSLLVASMVAISAACVDWLGSKSKFDDDLKPRRGPSSPYPRKEVVLALLLIVVAGLFPVTVQRAYRLSPVQTPAPGPDGRTVIKSMIWNIHFGYDDFARLNFGPVTELINNHDINVIGILESDMSRTVNGNLDYVEWLEEGLNMYSDFGPSTAKNTWGCGMLSKFPILSSNKIVLPSPEGELACLIDAIVEVDGKPVSIVITHFGNTEDVLDRELQTKGTYEVLAKQTAPIVFLGYITDRPGSHNYQAIMAAGMSDTTTSLNRYCEYIFYKGLDMVKFYRQDPGDLSDTEAQVAHFTLPR